MTRAEAIAIRERTWRALRCINAHAKSAGMTQADFEKSPLNEAIEDVEVIQAMASATLEGSDR